MSRNYILHVYTLWKSDSIGKVYSSFQQVCEPLIPKPQVAGYKRLDSDFLCFFFFSVTGTAGKLSFRSITEIAVFIDKVLYLKEIMSIQREL